MTEFPRVSPVSSFRTPQTAPASASARDTINAIFDGMANETARTIAGLRCELDALEQLTLKNAASAKGHLSAYLGTMDTVRAEAKRIADVIDTMAHRQES